MSYNKPLICPKYNIERVYKNDKSRPSGKALYCPECVREKQRDYWSTHPNLNERRRGKYNEHYHESNLQRFYGLTTVEYNQLFADQNGTCAICHQPETATNQYGIKNLAVDHDHTTGQVRGLLCSSCNMMIGKAKDNPCVLEAAAQYLHDYAC